MSRLNVGMPAARTAATACDTLAGTWVRPSDGQHRGHHRLHTDADPIHAGRRVGPHHLHCDVVGIALHSDLSAGGQRYHRQHRCKPIGRNPSRRTSADEHARDRVERGTGDVDAQRVEVVADHMVAIRPRRERAVVAAVPAERYVDVDAERPRGTTGGSKCHYIGRYSRSSASRR